MRTPLIAGVLGIVVMLSACGGSSGSAASDQDLERKADTYAISQIERYFHESTAKKDIEEMMSLWTENATFTYGPGQTATLTLPEGRHLWTQILRGDVDVNGRALAAGDGLAASSETGFRFAAGSAPAELLAFDLA